MLGKVVPSTVSPLAEVGSDSHLFTFKGTLVLYMSSSFWLLGIESRDFCHAEKERTACKAVQIHKMTTTFTQNGPRLSF